jgi:hypothetical protein
MVWYGGGSSGSSGPGPAYPHIHVVINQVVSKLIMIPLYSWCLQDPGENHNLGLAGGSSPLLSCLSHIQRRGLDRLGVASSLQDMLEQLQTLKPPASQLVWCFRCQDESGSPTSCKERKAEGYSFKSDQVWHVKEVPLHICARPDGTVYLEEGGQVTEQGVTAGYVVDTQPDLRVSRVLPWLLLGRSVF